MVEEQQRRVNDALTKMMDDVEKSHMRDLQVKTLRCAATCYEDKDSPISSVQNCISSCAFSLNNAQKCVEQELSYFQDRFQRCIMSCNDSIKDKMGSSWGTNDQSSSKYEKDFENCAKKCVDSHLDLLPGIRKNIKKALSKGEI